MYTLLLVFRIYNTHKKINHFSTYSQWTWWYKNINTVYKHQDEDLSVKQRSHEVWTLSMAGETKTDWGTEILPWTRSLVVSQESTFNILASKSQQDCLQIQARLFSKIWGTRSHKWYLAQRNENVWSHVHIKACTFMTSLTVIGEKLGTVQVTLSMTIGMSTSRTTVLENKWLSENHTWWTPWLWTFI